MKIAVIGFTQRGRILAEKVSAGLQEEGHHVTVDVKGSGMQGTIDYSLREWTARQFQSQDALIFIGAAGIAVRAIAPYVKSKQQDPAVIVIDEIGMHCIPLLSGHIGGANELALLICDKIKAQPVITTATDINQKWAVDVFAVKNGLQIQDMERAKKISAAILQDRHIKVDFQGNDKKAEGILPEELIIWEPLEEDMTKTEPDISVGIYQNPDWEQTLYLIPRVVTVGIGCRKDTSYEKIEKAVLTVLQQERIWQESICQAASIDLKENEPGILLYCEKHQLDFQVYSADTLNEVPGEFSVSDFVEQVTGVDNVCERSAVCASDFGKLIVKKRAADGVTVALAVKEWRIRFE